MKNKMSMDTKFNFLEYVDSFDFCTALTSVRSKKRDGCIICFLKRLGGGKGYENNYLLEDE